MENGNQLYRLSLDGHIQMGVCASISCYCRHHDFWEDVFYFFSTPTARVDYTKFMLCESTMTHVLGRRMIAELTVKNLMLSEEVHPPKHKKISFDKDTMHQAEVELSRLLIQMESKKVKFATVSEKEIEGCFKPRNSPYY